VLAALAGCAAAPPTVELTRVPFYPQEEFQCGPASLAALLVDSGVTVTPQELRPQVYTPARQGSLQVELLAAARRHGRLALVITPNAQVLREQLDAGRAVLVLQNFGTAGSPLWHYAVVIGYEPGGRAYLLRSGITPRQRLAARRFLATWARAGNWGLVLARADEVPRGFEAIPYLQAAHSLESSGQPLVAGQAYATAAARWPQEPAAWFALAGSQVAAGELRAAESSYRQLLAVAPDYAPAHNNLAMLLLGRGCAAAAAAELQLARAQAEARFADDLADTAARIATYAGPVAAPSACTAP
jgi:tetratricopeptide (TPR) repeat protein